jgi:hypothetical protein
LNKVAGVFFILIGGLVFAIVIGVIHFHKTKIKVQKLDVSKCIKYYKG